MTGLNLDAIVLRGEDAERVDYPAHTLRIPEGSARIIQVSIGPPYDGFARDMAALFAAGAGLGDIVATAAQHGVGLD